MSQRVVRDKTDSLAHLSFRLINYWDNNNLDILFRRGCGAVKYCRNKQCILLLLQYNTVVVTTGQHQIIFRAAGRTVRRARPLPMKKIALSRSMPNFISGDTPPSTSSPQLCNRAWAHACCCAPLVK
jgi:hypothetical protein